MPTTPTDVYAPQTYRLDPFYRAHLAAQIHVNLANGTYARGAVLGESATPGTFDHVLDTVIVAPSAAPTLTTPTGGSLAAGDYIVGYAFVNADGGQSALSPTDVTTAEADDVVHVAAVTPLPSGVASINWYMSTGPGDSDLALVLNNNGAAADFDAVPDPGAQAAPSGDLSGLAKAILRDACTVSGGNITLADDSGVTVKSVPVYVAGSGAYFKTDEMSGLTAEAIDELGATLISGTVADGVLAL
jgi:hypothetical protein